MQWLVTKMQQQSLRIFTKITLEMDFWEAADDTIAQYFDESIDHKIAEKMVRHAARIFMD